jgi:cytochrome c553
MMRRSILILALAVSSAALADGNPYLQYDRRVPITVTSHERNHVLFDMREMLHGMFTIQTAMARDDMKIIPEVALPMGRVMQHMPQELLIRMPDEYKYLGAGMQAAFTNVAEAAKANDHKKVEGYLAEAMTYCSGCHDTFKFVLGSVPKSK